jgi:hypothetical protein
MKIKIYRIIIFPVDLCGSETWSLTLREKQRLMVSENGALRNRFEPKKDAIMEEWKRIHNRA